MRDSDQEIGTGFGAEENKAWHLQSTRRGTLLTAVILLMGLYDPHNCLPIEAICRVRCRLFFKTVSSDHGMCMVRTCPTHFPAIMHLKCMIAWNLCGCVPLIRDTQNLFLSGGGRCRADHAAATKKGPRKLRGPFFEPDKNGAGDGNRTHDVQLGKLTFCL